MANTLHSTNLEQENEKSFYLEKIISLLSIQIYWKNKQGIYLGCNKFLAKILKLNSTHDIIGKTDYDLMDKEQAEIVVLNDKKVMDEGTEITAEEYGYNIHGIPAVYLTTKTPLYDEKNNVIGVVGISFDITDRKKAEEELRIAKNKAELASEIKSQFIQNMEHDLRTPAAGVYGLLNLIVNDVTEPKLKEMMLQTTKASKRLLDFLNDIIAFDKYTSGQLPLLSHEFDLYDMLNSVVEMEMPTVHDKNVELKLDIAKDVPQHIISDQHRIFRILLNLIGNAVKFTKEGHVKIFVGIEKQIDPRHCLLRIVVEDTGIGIPADKIHRIYERFERGTASNRGLYPGAGLGLSITKQFIDELQGDVNAESKEGEGTTFTCVIPCRIPLKDMVSYESIFNNLPSENQNTETELQENSAVFTDEPKIEKDTTPTPPQKKNKVLLVEDDLMAQILANGVLDSILHFDYDLAETGQEALELWSKNKYDFILMDLGLPDIKGDQVTKRIREKDKNTIIIALTAHDEEKVKKLCKKAGMQGFMTKPISSDKLIETLNDIQNTEAKAVETTPLAEPTITLDEKKQIFDLAICKRNARDNEELVKLLLNTFTKKLPEYLEEFKGYYANKDIKYLGLLAHKLKGASIIAGAQRLAAATEDLQHIAEVEKITLDGVEEFYNRVCAEIIEVSKALEKLGY